MENENKVRQGAVKYVIMLLVERVVGISMFFAAAGTFKDMRGLTNLGLYLVVSVISGVIMLIGHQNLRYY